MVTIVVAGIFHRHFQGSEPEVLLCRRGAHDTGAGFYEFPGGKVESGESEEQALVREMMEELSIKVKVQQILGSHQFQLPSGKNIHLKVYFIEGQTGAIRLTEHDHMKWVGRSTMDLDEIMTGDRPLMEKCFQKLDQIYGRK